MKKNKLKTKQEEVIESKVNNMYTRLRGKEFLSNWTPLDTVYFPPFRFLDITVCPTHTPPFARNN